MQTGGSGSPPGHPYTGPIPSMKPLVYSLLPRPAHPTRDGLAIRNYHLLSGLAGEFRVRAAVLAPPNLAGTGEYPPGVEAEEAPQTAGPANRPDALVRSALTGEAFPILLYRSRSLDALLERWIAREKPAWVVAHAYHVAPAAIDLGAPAWVDFHNLDSEIWRRMGQSASSGLHRAFARWQAPRVEKAESGIVRRSGGISCVSERDARALASLGGPPPLVVPNGVDLDRYAFRAQPAAQEKILFVGDLSWPPNAEGIAWFCDRVWPLVSRLRPSARVEILGRGERTELSRIIRDPPAGAAFLGEGGDTRPHWNRAALSVVPLLAGGGTRLKILEAAACGVPVVSTPVGAEGLDLTDGLEIRLAAEPEEFASVVASLLADPDARRAQAAAARRRVETRHDWRQIGRRFARELASRAGAR